MERFIFHVPQDLLTYLRERAADRGVSVAEVLRSIITEDRVRRQYAEWADNQRTAG